MRSAFRAAILLQIAVTASVAFAADPAAIFASVYSDPRIYRPGWCGANVRELIRVFEKEGVDLTHAHAIYFLNEMRSSGGVPFDQPHKLTPAYSRDQAKVWDYHAILEVDGRIYDLDSLSRPQAPDEYFELMFPSAENEDRAARIVTRVIPALDYARDFDAIANVDAVGRKYQSLELKDPPVDRARAWLNRLRSL